MVLRKPPVPSLSRVVRALIFDDRGDVGLEYIVLVGTIAIPAIAAFVAVGKLIVDDYTTLQSILVLPLP